MNAKTCSILYGPGKECVSQHPMETSTHSVTATHSNTVVIGLDSLPTKKEKYCFIITASNGTFTTIIEGTINMGT